MITIGLLGANGKMGTWVLQLLNTEYKTQARLGAAAGQGDPLTPLMASDVIIDFSLPNGTKALLSALEGLGRDALPALVIGTTGLDEALQAKLDALSRKTGVFLSSNFSAGVYLLQTLLAVAGPLAATLGYTPVLTEVHHRHKKDAPSGTAVTLLKALSPKDSGKIETHSIRAGEVIGEHEIAFYGAADVLRLSHSAQDRSVFARGALDVAIWLGKHKGSLQGRRLGMEDFFKSKLEARTPS